MRRRHSWMRPRSIIIAIVLLGCDQMPRVARVDSSPAKPTDAPAEAWSAGSFGYVDSTGTQLLALDSLAMPSSVRAAICPGALPIPVRYDQRQARRPEDNGRQQAYNFANEAGQVFRLQGGRATMNQSCYLSSDSGLIAFARPVAMRKPEQCSTASADRITAAKARNVVHCWHIGDVTPRLAVLAVQFVNIDSSSLASLVVVDDSSLLFDDFPAVRNKLEGSTWRVDDGGVFSPEDLTVLFVATMPNGTAMATTWAGAEGESDDLLLAMPRARFHSVLKGYRYWSPM